MLRWNQETGAVNTFREPAHGANGNTTDEDGRLITCEQYSRRLTRTERNVQITVLVESFDGKRFNAPNDVVVKSDGTIWFTDPDYGRSSDYYEGSRELPGCHVYRFDPVTGATRQMTEDLVMPNGLAFSTDESCLYVVDTGSTHVAGGPNHVRRFEVGGDATLRGGDVVCSSDAEMFDGLRVDRHGNLWMGAEDGVRVYSRDGKMIGRIHVPERVSNLCFGGRSAATLFMTGASSLYSLETRL